MDSIKIRGARTHNLKNINLDLPRNKLVVITGLSGSGKSSLAFDTLYAEGQRRYVESLSSYARQFLQLMAKPDVDLMRVYHRPLPLNKRPLHTIRALPSHRYRNPRLFTLTVCSRGRSVLPRSTILFCARKVSRRWLTMSWSCRKAHAS